MIVYPKPQTRHESLWPNTAQPWTPLFPNGWERSRLQIQNMDLLSTAATITFRGLHFDARKIPGDAIHLGPQAKGKGLSHSVLAEYDMIEGGSQTLDDI